MTPVRVAIVDDHPIVCLGLAELIGEQPGMEVAGTAGTIAEARALMARVPVDVAIIDLWLGAESGLDLVTAIARDWPATRMLMLSGHDERIFAERALAAGALGYIMKERAAGELVTAIARVSALQTYVSPDMAERVLSATNATGSAAMGTSPLDRLSNRERHVLVLIGRGLGRAEIARTLGVSVKTVESHYAHIKDKLGARNARELTRLAIALTRP